MGMVAWVEMADRDAGWRLGNGTKDTTVPILYTIPTIYRYVVNIQTTRRRLLAHETDR